ncbi:MAG: hypothetical protein ACP5GY_03720 [Vulcanisaeta sp.]
MQINKSFIIVIMLSLIIATTLLPIEALGGSNYIGFYSSINWPVISVSIINGSHVDNGIIIIISPSTKLNQQYEIFSGIYVVGSDYFLVNGVIYINGTIYITALTPVNVTLSSSNVKPATGIGNVNYGGFEYMVKGGHTYRAGQIESQTIGLPTIHSINSVGNMNNFNINNAINGSEKATYELNQPHPSNTKSPSSLILNASLITTLLLIILLLASPFIKYELSNNKDCINREFTKLIKKLGLNDPSLTHRDIGNYLKKSLYLDDDLIDHLINYYEIAMYSNKNVECEEFKALINEIINARIRRRG